MKEYKTVALLGISIDKTMLDRIDKDRGDVSRSMFVRRLLEKAYGVKSK